MNISKTVIQKGDPTQVVQKYDEVAIEYTGWIFDPNQPDGKGTKFDTSIGRGDTVTVIGAGRLIKGWDKGVIGDYEPEIRGETVGPMALHEKARFKFPHTYAYGVNGFPGWIPQKATLIYELEVKRIGPHRAP
ncbi:hypothetical protein B5807_07277 [Epicoccum nigrum]|uniref:peptidylprolyl isomerase n=1 Tax=Epicoccum nigrum TaxID=105696 RepID=A0A1Y2LUD1_EPING|nr:hypothetical protein B5807_07277 [Epicoccum nigrum]